MGEQGIPLKSVLRNLLREYRFEVSLAVLVGGAFLSLISFAAYSPLIADPPFSSFVPSLLGADCANPSVCPANPSGYDWTLLFVILGGILLIVGIYMVVTYLVARQKFEHLMKTKSKAEFVRNMTEVEDLLWDLTPKDEIRLVKKKQELRVRD